MIPDDEEEVGTMTQPTTLPRDTNRCSRCGFPESWKGECGCDCECVCNCKRRLATYTDVLLKDDDNRDEEEETGDAVHTTSQQIVEDQNPNVENDKIRAGWEWFGVPCRTRMRQMGS